ncbi:MAG: AAA family ATPase [Acidovorax temperans]|uniref:AAA family ATPase n=1 Tax=Acidovorax temperans TaxID=80878 RepID=UPI00391A32BD
MYTTELKLTNFKRFPSQPINMSSKITLLLGPNSSGKSSVIKALLGLKQTASPSNENEVFSAQGEYVDLGVYKDYVSDHDIKKKLKIALKIRESLDPFGRRIERDLQIEFCFGHDFATEQARLLEIFVRDQSKDEETLISLVKKQTRDSFLLKISESLGSQLLNDIFDSKDHEKRASLLAVWTNGVSVLAGDRYQFTLEHTKVRTDKAKDYFRNIPVSLLTRLVSSVLRGLDRDFFYTGPLRRSPSRSYGRTAHLLSVGPAGEHTPSVLANLKSRAAKERSKERPQSKRLDQLNKWVEAIFPGCHIESKAVEELVKLEIVRSDGGREVISDVGFGISQVLPILVQAAVMPADTTLLIEQPELHLHPSAQTKFAEVIADASNSGRRFLIETHSEHFVRGLQLAVSNGSAKKGLLANRLQPSDVTFIYVPRFPASPHQLYLDEWGDFLVPWPSGFFDEGYLATMKLLSNKIAAQNKHTTTSSTADAIPSPKTRKGSA